MFAWFFCFHYENENEAVETYPTTSRSQDQKTTTSRFEDQKPRHRDSGTKTPRHREIETIKPRHRDSKAFFQRTKSHDIEILWNSDLCPLITNSHAVAHKIWMERCPPHATGFLPKLKCRSCSVPVCTPSNSNCWTLK